jgi:hypothetical protein
MSVMSTYTAGAIAVSSVLLRPSSRTLSDSYS